MSVATSPKRVVVLGGGFGGMYTARRLERRLPPDEAEIVLINPENYMLYTPLLPEAAAGTVEPRHVVVPLRQALRRLSEHDGVGKVLGMPISGLLGWLVTRTYHWFALPTWTRRLRVGLDWAVAAAFPRDVAELGTLGHPEPLPSPQRRD